MKYDAGTFPGQIASLKSGMVSNIASTRLPGDKAEVLWMSGRNWLAAQVTPGQVTVPLASQVGPDTWSICVGIQFDDLVDPVPGVFTVTRAEMEA